MPELLLTLSAEKWKQQAHPFKIVEICEALVGLLGPGTGERLAQLPHAPGHREQHRRVPLIYSLFVTRKNKQKQAPQARTITRVSVNAGKNEQVDGHMHGYMHARED